MAKFDAEAVAIGDAVRDLLSAHRLTLATTSRLTGVPLATLSRRVNGTLPFTFRELRAIARLCAVSVADIAEAAEQIIAERRSGPASAAGQAGASSDD